MTTIAILPTPVTNETQQISIANTSLAKKQKQIKRTNIIDMTTKKTSKISTLSTGPCCPICGIPFGCTLSNQDINRHVDRCLRTGRGVSQSIISDTMQITENKNENDKKQMQIKYFDTRTGDKDKDITSRQGGTTNKKSHRQARRHKHKFTNSKGRRRGSRTCIPDDWCDTTFRKRAAEWEKAHRYVERPSSPKHSSEDTHNATSPTNALSLDVRFDSGLIIPRVLWEKLYNFQQLALKWLWELHLANTGGILADEMGLGKTVQAISILASLHYSRRIEGPILVVCPATVLSHWVSELHKWYPPLRVLVMHASGEGLCNRRLSYRSLLQKAERNSGVVIATYSGLRSNDFKLLGIEWAYSVLDEGHRIRNPDAQITQICKRLRCHHRLILTGAPVQNNLKELWSLIDFVHPGRLGTLPSFEEHFATPLRLGGYAGASELYVQAAYRCTIALRGILAPLVLRRMKDSVGNETSMADIEKTERVLFCRLTPTQINMYRSVLRNNADLIRAAGIKRSTSKFGYSNRRGRGHARVAFPLISLLRKICNHPSLASRHLQNQAKMEISYKKQMRSKSCSNDFPSDSDQDIEEKYGAVHESGKLTVLDRILPLWHKAGHRCLLFSSTTSMLSLIELVLRQHGFAYLRMDGKTPVGKRPQLIQKFNAEESNIFAFLLTSRVGGVGINLTGANRVIIFEPDWNPSTDIQARERAWRIGQHRDVTVYRLITAGCIEEKIYQRQIFKLFLSNKILNGQSQHRLFTKKKLSDLFLLDVDDSKGTEDATIKLANYRVPSRPTQEQARRLQKVLSSTKRVYSSTESHVSTSNIQPDTAPQASTLKAVVLARQLEKPVVATDTENLFEGISLAQAINTMSESDRRRRRQHRHELKIGRNKATIPAINDSCSDSSSDSDSDVIGDLSMCENAYQKQNRHIEDNKQNLNVNEKVNELSMEKSIVKALLNSDEIRGTFDHDKAEGVKEVCKTRLTSSQAEKIAQNALAQLQRSRAQVQAKPVHRPTWTGLMGSAGRNGSSVASTKSLLEQIRQRQQQLQNVDVNPGRGTKPARSGRTKMQDGYDRTGDDGGEDMFMALAKQSPYRTKFSSPTSASRPSDNLTCVDVVDIAEELLRRMMHWFRRRDGVARTQAVLDAFQSDVNEGNTITPTVFKGLLKSICAFKDGHWILNDYSENDT